MNVGAWIGLVAAAVYLAAFAVCETEYRVRYGEWRPQWEPYP